MANQQRIQLLEKYIKDEPDEPFNHYALALEYYESEPRRALDILKKLSSSHSSYLPTFYKLAHLLWELQFLDDAEQIFKKGIELAQIQNDQKALSELKAAYQNFQFDLD